MTNILQQSWPFNSVFLPGNDKVEYSGQSDAVDMAPFKYLAASLFLLKINLLDYIFGLFSQRAVSEQ